MKGFDLLKIRNMIIRPSNTISMVQKSEASPKDPIPLLLLIGIVSGFGSFLTARKTVAPLLEAISALSEAGGFVGVIATISGIFSFLGGFIGIFLTWVGATVIFHTLAKLLGGEGRFKKLLEVEGWCFVPLFFGALVNLVVIAFFFPPIKLPAQLISDPTQFGQIVKNLTRTLEFSVSFTFSRVFGRMMTFWVLLLSGIAVKKEYGLPRTKAALSVLLPYFAYFMISSLLARMSPPFPS